MNYQRLHDAIIAHHQQNPPTGYTEKHHIVPRCMGGTNDKSNLVRLTARAHFVVHRLLCKIYPSNPKLWYAFDMMHKSLRNSRLVDCGWSKSVANSRASAWRKMNNPRAGVAPTDNVRLRRKAGYTDTVRRKMSLSHIGIVQTSESKEKLRRHKEESWEITFPDGTTHIIVNLKRFCLLHGLHSGAMSLVGAGKRRHHHGYSVKPYQR